MPRRRVGERMPMTSLHLTKEMIEGLDWLVQKGAFPNRSEAIRTAISMLLVKMEYPKSDEWEGGFPVLRGRW